MGTISTRDHLPFLLSSPLSLFLLSSKLLRLGDFRLCHSLYVKKRISPRARASSSAPFPNPSGFFSLVPVWRPCEPTYPLLANDFFLADLRALRLSAWSAAHEFIRIYRVTFPSRKKA